MLSCSAFFLSSRKHLWECSFLAFAGIKLTNFFGGFSQLLSQILPSKTFSNASHCSSCSEFCCFKFFSLKNGGNIWRDAPVCIFFYLTMWPLSLLKYRTKTLNVKISFQQLHQSVPSLPVSRYGCCCPPGMDLTSLSGRCASFLLKWHICAGQRDSKSRHWPHKAEVGIL